MSKSLTKTKLIDPLILTLLQNIRGHRSKLKNLKSIEFDPNLSNIISNEVEFLNQNRRRIEKNVVDEALKRIDNKRFTNVVYGEGWNQGVLGIVASRIIEKSYKPTIVMTESNQDVLTGSVRSVKDYDVYQSLSDCKDNIIQYGGHKYAAGLKIKNSKMESLFLIRTKRICNGERPHNH